MPRYFDWFLGKVLHRQGLSMPEVGRSPHVLTAGVTLAVAFAITSADAWAADAGAAAPAPASTATAAAATPEPGVAQIPLLLIKENLDVAPPLSLLDIPPADQGISGAKLAISDNNTTGRFTKQNFTLDVIEGPNPDELISQAVAKVDGGTHFIIAMMSPASLLKLSDALKAKEALILNASSNEDDLREENCRANVMHTAPTRSMLADALAQYLAWKQWRNWFLISGPQDVDKRLVDQFKRSAKRFGAKIVEERTYTYEPGSRRSDGGFEQIQQQLPSFTQNAAEHDVVIVADEGQLFADYLPYRTWTPRPVAGSAGLVAASWHPAIELWGGTQFQNRFRRLANRPMREIDYNVWLAVRVIGEAATRKASGDFKTLHQYIHSPEFELAAFKGVKTTFRDWNGQLRQPLLVTTPKMLVSVSPQQGFLHQLTELDTLGLDKPETKCVAYTQ